ncbi:30S ribosomal protein S11 [Limihaloglobus sulfuriphilus]|uniref:Small ribosomal subunit protein uS11 n=1 Tax=Limihaloglobus sulfuriphilus TaxID=1851148 RepID=A0A1Q2MIE5_9BACT|nr:30S ribosomal protein S11 [Limihaloglobus sulfuriphilus]AQQ72032.1 30S ribosomal protein S11 [Limihaloglobus sulfuriphilus]
MAKSVRRRVKKNIPKAIVHIKASFNNTLVVFTDPEGGAISQDSGGSVGFKGSRKSTPFAAQRAAEQASYKAKRHGVNEVEVRLNGPGSGRESAITAIQSAGIRIASIEDVTALPHNGCRPSKRRRV